MSLLLLDTSGSTIYTFPADFDLLTFDDREFGLRSKLIDRFGAPGGAETSDREIEPRRVKITGTYHGASQAATTSFLDDLTEALHNNGNAIRFSWETDWYINVASVRKFDPKRYKGALAYKSVDIDLEFNCADPFWYHTTDVSVGPTTISASPTDIVINNTGNVESPLRIQCDPTATWDDFTIANTSDGSNTLRYQDLLLGNGDQLIIDAQDGTCERDSLNTIRYLIGHMLRVLPGNNTIRYTGDTGGTITLSCPRRRL